MKIYHFIRSLHVRMSLFFLMVNLFCLSLGSAQMPSNFETINDKKEVILNEVTAQLIDSALKDYGLYCIGTGGSSDEKIKQVSIHFNVRRRATIEEARELQLKIVDRYLKLINQNEAIRPYLNSHPFTPDNLEVVISFVRDDNFDFADGTICLVFNVKGRLFYRCQDIFEYRLSKAFDEPYEEAVKIVESQPLKYDLKIHKDQGFEKEMDDFQFEFIRLAYKKYGLKYEDYGGKMGNGIDQVAFDFVCHKKTSLEKARKMEVELTQMLVDQINSNPHFRPYLKEYPFTAKNAPIRIHFMDKKGNFYEDGSVSRMHQQDGRIYYFREFKPKKYVVAFLEGDPLTDESFDEAAQLVKNKDQ